MASNEAYKVDNKIRNFVIKMATSGLSANKIFQAVQAKGYQNCPSSQTTFNKLYKPFADQVKYEKIQKVADKVYERALDEGDFGHFPSQELILSTQAQWSKTQVNVDLEVEADKDDSSIKALMEKLGIEED